MAKKLKETDRRTAGILPKWILVLHFAAKNTKLAWTQGVRKYFSSYTYNMKLPGQESQVKER